MGLLERYELMKQAQFSEQHDSEEVNKLAAEEMDILAKYAEFADQALQEEYGDDYTLEDVEKLAEMLIEHDLNIYEEEVKVAELAEAGQLMARAFVDELQRLAE